MAILHTIKYWLHLHEQQNMNKFAFQRLQSADNTESLYAENIKTLLKFILDMYGKTSVHFLLLNLLKQ